MSILIKDTTKEEREKIVSESIGNINGACDGCMAGLAGGKCKVRVLDGELKISTMDRIQLTEDELSFGMRLACQAMPEQTVKIEI